MVRSVILGRMELVIASHNQGKIREIGALLAPFSITVTSAAQYNLPEPDETGESFRENAELKARASAEVTGKWALADDSGLCVTALAGAPGIYSARWAGPDKNFQTAMEKIQDSVLEFEDRSAYFVCGLALAGPNGEMHYWEGRIDGQLCWPPRGQNGFGYDPMFVPEGYQESFGEMVADQKHKMSHRARAFDKMMRDLPSLNIGLAA